MESRVRVYKNLNNGLWSVKQRIEGKWVVVGHCVSCVLNDAVPVISDARHEWVRSGNHREVFAYLEGSLVQVAGFKSFRGRSAVVSGDFGSRVPSDCTRLVTFRPFADVKQGFVYAAGNGSLPFAHADMVMFTPVGVFAS